MRELEPGSPEAIELARRHFEKALGHYRSGDYEAAVRELEHALTLDPEGKDLVYNLALLFEKLGELDRAIQYFQRFAQMETDQEELSRVYAMIRRLRGARAIREAHRERRAPPPRRETRAASEPDSRVDGWLWTAGGVAVAAAIVGGVFGVKALSENPGPEDRTGAGVTFNALRDRAATAHQSAVIADVAFLVALVSAGTTGVLYFGRPEAKSSAQRAWRVEF